MKKTLLQELSDEQLERYSRHVILDIVDEKGQLKLLNSRVLVVGAGGLGSPVLLYLAAAGIGTIGIIDHDIVEESNLQRQIIHTENDIGRAKITSAKEKIHDINNEVSVVTYRDRLSSATANSLFPQYDIIIDGSDNFTTRYCVNAFSIKHKKPFVSGSVSRFEGQIFSYSPILQTACYKCIFPTPPSLENIPKCDTVGIFGSTTGIIGSIQANEVLKILLDIGHPLYNKILLFDGLKPIFRTIKTKHNPLCTACSKNI